ncbi:chlorophyll synthesis pathway protein BchC [Dichotomicrobium thermohalophilum]|uniref:3-hydroxyethyl bacteriochlorophyllide a dehydrogenase n=1 Tax=Dichotomicrobium thermohalophilum TaxID=933063 RepID=A0A397Q6R3_9HYPH|nr:chlorophyll synthesis pathway protein BchC [Dichotomicrobium thermohalophilum]RIA56738.1 3-hydroxyethyl bacteriochlorophyllide a dehydrogenase [Dichotomicrobium thermohalophilum]
MTAQLDTTAVVLERPEKVKLDRLTLPPVGEDEIVVDIAWSGISTGTEKLLWSGRMPHFPGMGYPLVPGYESVGHVREAGPNSGRQPGEMVFVPGARCYGEVRGLFGGAASRVVVPGNRVAPIPETLGEQGILLALAATAYHALVMRAGEERTLIVGHGVLGRLLVRLSTELDTGPPVVWETNADRATGATGYEVVHPDSDDRKDYATIFDVSGDPNLLDTLIARLTPRGEVILAGFYSERLSFAFPPAFMREATIKIAAEWKPDDLTAVCGLIEAGRLNLDGLISHRETAARADEAYQTAFNDPACLKMILDWRA